MTHITLFEFFMDQKNFIAKTCVFRRLDRKYRFFLFVVRCWTRLHYFIDAIFILCMIRFFHYTGFMLKMLKIPWFIFWISFTLFCIFDREISLNAFSSKIFFHLVKFFNRKIKKKILENLMKMMSIITKYT